MPRILIQNATLVTMNPAREIVNGDILVEGDRIAAINPVGDGILSNREDLRVIDASNKIVLPGLVQAHIHLCQTLFRGQADDLELLTWLRQRIWPLEAEHNPDSLYYSALLGCAELFLSGTTCIMDMETVHHTDAAFEAISACGMRAISGKVMMDYGADLPPKLREKTADSLEESQRLLEKWHNAAEGRIKYALQPRFAVSCSEQLLQEVGRLARHYGVMVHTHASESQAEIALVRQERGARNVQYLHQLGLTGEHLLLAHCIWLDEEEIEILRATGTRVAHCPSSNLKLASGVAPVPEFLAKGISVGLGADGAPCANNLDLFWEMRLAALIHKIRYGPQAMPAAQVLEMATIGGAKAIGLDHEIGSIEVGKKADLVILDLQQFHAQPAVQVDLVSQLVYSAKASDVVSTMVNGKMVMEDRQLRTIQEVDVLKKCNQLMRKMALTV